MKVAFYIRVGTHAEVEDGSKLANQLSELTAWADRGGHEVVQIYRDLGASGTDVCRPAFRRMMADAALVDHPFDAVVVTSLSRISRDAFSLATHDNQLSRVRVKLISIALQRNDNEAGQMIRKILDSFDAYLSNGSARKRRLSSAHPTSRTAQSPKALRGAESQDFDQPNKDVSS